MAPSLSEMLPECMVTTRSHSGVCVCVYVCVCVDVYVVCLSVCCVYVDVVCGCLCAHCNVCICINILLVQILHNRSLGLKTVMNILYNLWGNSFVCVCVCMYICLVG